MWKPGGDNLGFAFERATKIPAPYAVRGFVNSIGVNQKV